MCVTCEKQHSGVCLFVVILETVGIFHIQCSMFACGLVQRNDTPLLQTVQYHKLFQYTVGVIYV